ncbi:MAG: transglycosylase domain-containing protein [Bacteroidales bacterium]|nr:transglycosylase domain-containing protein [Bacteroidales bacterium]
MSDKTKKKIISWYWLLLCAPFVLVTLMLIIVALCADIPSFEELERPDNKLATQVIAEGGEVLCTFHIENRTYVDYKDLSPNLVHAAVATEDKRFYRHSGVDIRGLGRVFFKTLLRGDMSQGGGSTITQQLAKTLYPRTESRSRVPGWSKVVMVWNKLREWITAVRLERDYTKEEIMAMYLNSIFFGSEAYGVRTAAETFFAKRPADLSVEESATLIGMVNKPTRYNPVRNYNHSIGRRNFVMDRMVQAGYLKAAEADSLKQLPIILSYSVLDHNSGLAPYFRDRLRRDMSANKPKRSAYSDHELYSADSLRWESDAIFGWLNKNHKPDGSRYDLDRDGLRIYTTINYKMQQYAEEAVAEHLGKNLQPKFQAEQKWKRNKPFANDVSQENIGRLMMQARKWSDRYRMQKKRGVSEQDILAQFSKPVKMRVFSWNKKGYVDTLMTPDDSIRYYKGILRAGFVAIEPQTGHVKAYVGGPNYRYFKYDNVGQGRRQVGSTIKPFIYAYAMEQGMTPCYRLIDQTYMITLPSGETWAPKQDGGTSGATVTLKWGLSRSKNNISAFLMKTYGPEAVVSMMRRMGISGRIDAVHSLCVGAADISPYEMVAAYNTFPSKGIYIYPNYVRRIEDNQGTVLSEFTSHSREAMDAAAAYEMITMMQGVVNNGTGYRLRGQYGLKGDIAGKTGTTNDNSDGWFIGYTPFITAGVWTGAEDRQVHFQSTALGQGANAALPIWAIFMKKCLADSSLDFSEADRFMPPSGVHLDIDCPDIKVSEDGGIIEEESIEDRLFN